MAQAQVSNLPAERPMEYEVAGQTVKLTPGMVRQYLVTGNRDLVTDQEVIYFMNICRSRGLNPFNKDCYLIKYTQDPAAIIVSIDKLRYQARKSEDCIGWQSGVIVQKEDGSLRYSKGLILDGEKLIGGWFKAKPAKWQEAFELEVNLNGYIKTTREGKTTRFWSPENQPTMIAKVAEAQGLRRLWPEQMQGLYLQEEVAAGIDHEPIEAEFKNANSEPDAIFDEAFSPYAGLDYFEEFVKATMTSNRCSRNDIVKAANENPQSFISTLEAWMKKRNGNGKEAVPPVEAEQGEPDSARARRPRKPKTDPGPEASQQPEDPEAAELEAVKRKLSQYEAAHLPYVLQAKRNTGIAHATSLDGASRLLEEVEKLLAERPPK